MRRSAARFRLRSNTIPPSVLVKGGQFIENAPRLSHDIHQEARAKIGSRMHVFNQQSDVLGDKPGVFIERKEFSLALIFAAKAHVAGQDRHAAGNRR